MSQSKITKAIIPAAGLGTRFLPATKAMPKEMLPIVDKPAIQYVVEEAVSSDLTDVLIITGRNKGNISNHFDSVPELEDALDRKGDQSRLNRVHATTDLADVHFLRQGQPLGLGHAVARAKNHVAGQSFAVLLGDDLIDPRDPLLSKMIEVHERENATVIALMEVPESSVHMYGCADASATDDADVVRVSGLVEKPKPEDAPSNLAIIGRYILTSDIFGLLENLEPGHGNEIQLTDALNALAHSDDHDVYGVVFRGRRYDTGDKSEWIKANVRLGVEDEEFGDELRTWLTDFARSGGEETV